VYLITRFVKKSKYLYKQVWPWRNNISIRQHMVLDIVIYKRESSQVTV